MGIFDKAKDALGDNPNQGESGIDRAADFADDRTGGTHTDQISSVADPAGEKAADYLGSPEDSTANPTPSAPPAGSPEPPD